MSVSDELTGQATGAGLDGTTVPLLVLVDQQGAVLRPAGSPLRLDVAELHWLAVRYGADDTASPAPAVDEAVERRLEQVVADAATAAWRPRPLPDHPGPVVVSPDARPATGSFRLCTPFALVLTRRGFTYLDHRGAARAHLGWRELAAALSFTAARDVAAAVHDQADRLGAAALSGEESERLVATLVGAGLLLSLDSDAARRSEGRVQREFRKGVALQRRRAEEVAKTLVTLREAEAERTRRTGRVRTKVVPVNSEGNPLLSLGLVMSHAAAVDGGRLSEAYEFVPDWGDQTVPALTGDEPPAVYLFSNYIWSHAWNVLRSAQVKAKSPGSVTVHGGPNTPKYPADIRRFFETNPHVDIAVHGEGEATFADLLDALQGSLGDGPPVLSVLRDVPGLTFRDGSEVVTTGKRDRIADLDVIPSPYETGLFDTCGDVEITLMTIETNRGCPYGCTYCDWGSATLSRIRKFDLERVFRELEWCAEHKVRTVFCADANYGIFARDVDIARKIVELKQTYGYPVLFESSYAKNTVKHLREIIEELAKGDILSTGTLSLQSVDTDTLDTIQRSNIKLEKYDELAVEFGKQGLPLVIELMMGLPGSTLPSFLGDLQQTIDREVKARVHPTEVLMNSPMNAPDYRQDHEIETLRPVFHDWTTRNGVRRKALVVSTSTFSRDDYDTMERYRRAFLLGENFGVFRQVSRFVRQETGLSEMQFYARIADDVASQPGRWPVLAFTLDSVIEYMIPPASWQLLMDELRSYLVGGMGVPAGSALECVLAVQHAVLPARGRSFPSTVELRHDYSAWHRAILDAKRSGHAADWARSVPRLATFGPATFEVEDPQSICEVGFGMPLAYDNDADWELASPVARPMRFRNAAYA